MANDTHKAKNPHEGHRERLREKFRLDPELTMLHDHEILELLLSYVIPRKDTNPIAHELLDMFGSLDSVLHAAPNELKRCKNMTTNASYLLSTLYPAVRRAMRAKSTGGKRVMFMRPEDSIEYLHKYFIGRREEAACVLLLDINYKLLQTVFKKGGAAAVSLSPAELTSIAVREGASYAIVAHNHPTGDVTPSFDDLDLTRDIIDALMSVDVQLVDHVIFDDYNYFSFHNNGILHTILKDLGSRFKGTLAEDSVIRRQFLTQLNEYVLAPGRSSERGFSTVMRGADEPDEDEVF